MSQDKEFIIQLIELTTDRDVLCRWFCELNCFKVPKEFNCEILEDGFETEMMDKISESHSIEFKEWNRYWNVKYNKKMTDEEYDAWVQDRLVSAAIRRLKGVNHD